MLKNPGVYNRESCLLVFLGLLAMESLLDTGLYYNILADVSLFMR